MTDREDRQRRQREDRARKQCEDNDKTERAEEREREWFGEHLLHPTLCIKSFVLLLIRSPHGTVLLDMVGLDRMAVGMDVDVAAGWDDPSCVPRTSGSARGAALENCGVLRIADTVRASRTILRRCRRPRSNGRLQSWRRR